MQKRRAYGKAAEKKPSYGAKDCSAGARSLREVRIWNSVKVRITPTGLEVGIKGGTRKGGGPSYLFSSKNIPLKRFWGFVAHHTGPTIEVGLVGEGLRMVQRSPST